MPELRRETRATGGPGIEPRWTRSAKEGIGTAYSTASGVWFTLSAGILNEIYYPTIDRPQIRDFQYLVTDGESFFHDERRHTSSTLEPFDSHTLGYRVVNEDPEGRYRIRKEVFTDPHLPCVLVRTRFEPGEAASDGLHLFALLAPHLEVGGWGNTGNVTEVAGRTILTAHKRGTWLALGGTIPFLRASCGYVGTSDGWSDLHADLRMDFDFETAEDGNIALTAELDVGANREFTLGVAFGDSLQAATNTLLQALATPVEEHLERFGEQWTRACRGMAPLHRQAGDGGALYHRSHSLLLAHEDKTYPGALIASLSIPWGDAMGDEDLGGYHLVWTRDMINSATALLAAGNTATPLRALIYLAAVQRADGGFHQNFWLDGSPYWRGVQLDEAAFPILLAWRLREMNALQGFDPWPMVLRASGFLIRKGPATEQERWEEASGYSPSTLASNIAALTCAAHMASERSDDATAGFLQSYADFLHAHVLSWTVTDEGGLVPGIRRHFIRINPVDPDDSRPDEDPDHGVLRIRNLPPDAVSEFPANRIVDAGFLELVRYGLFSAGDDLFEDSLRVVDAVLKVDTPMGPCWRRYNHDGYGQREDGGPFLGWGKGRAWPLLTGERGHYELAAGRDAGPYLRAMEAFSEATGLLPEQVWDGEDLPQAHMAAGRPTGSAMPLMWAHAEYVKLLRSMVDGCPFDRIPEVHDRYVVDREATPIEVWKFSRQPRVVPAQRTLRVVAEAPFRLRWSDDDWATLHDSDATATAAGLHFVDLATNDPAGPPLRFTFFWTESGRWEGKDFDVRTEPLAS